MALTDNLGLIVLLISAIYFLNKNSGVQSVVDKVQTWIETGEWK